MFKALQWLLLQPADGLSAAEKLVLAVLYSMAKPNGQSDPSQKYLAKVTGLGERTVREALKKLTDEKLIVRQHRWIKGEPTSDLITVLWPDEVKALLSNGADRPMAPVGTGDNCRQTYKTKQTRQTEESRLPRLADIEVYEEMPRPGDLYPLRNRIRDVVEPLRDSRVQIDWDSPGIQDVRVLAQWVTACHVNFVVAVVLGVALKHGRKPRPPILSWRYFAGEIERNAQADPGSARDDKDHKWERFAAALKRRQAIQVVAR